MRLPERAAQATLGWEMWDRAPVLSLEHQGRSSDLWVFTHDRMEGTGGFVLEPPSFYFVACAFQTLTSKSPLFARALGKCAP